MNDVNLTSPNLKLVVQNDQRQARVSASSQAQSPDVSARVLPANVKPVSQQVSDPTKVQDLKAENKEQAEELKSSVSQLNQYVQSLHRSLEFQVDNQSGQTVVKVVDQETDKVIRQIPDELALRLAEKLQQDEPLTLLNIEV